MKSGVPQESVLGPILFLLYTANLVKLVQCYGLSVHLYADDIQIYSFCLPSSVDQLQMRVSACVDSVANCMSSNRLQLNAIKTEFLWCTSAQRQSQLPASPFRVCSDHVTPSTAVHDLGIYLNSDVSMHFQVSQTVSACFGSYVAFVVHCLTRSSSLSLLLWCRQSSTSEMLH